MATTYDNASLVMIPSGVKEDKLYSIKPTDGSGDFTFSRGSDIEATRVNSSGLIEKAKVNLLKHSNTFNSTWGTYDTSVTIGQTGYDGSSDAWLLDITGATGFQTIRQTISNSGAQTFSIYAKAGTLDWMRLTYAGGTGPTTYFDIANGVLGSVGGGFADIEDVGNGWYRCSTSFSGSFTELRIYPATANNNPTQSSGNILIQDAQLNHGLIAKDYIETTTTAVVEGLTADLPRLDYSGGASCPSLLLEPSRTNLLTQSEYIGAWTGFGGIQTITDNYAVSPEGVQNAARVELERSPTLSRIQLSVSGTSNGVSFVYSVYLKANSGSPYVYLQGGPNTSTAIEVTNEWQRYELVGTASGGTTTCIIGISDSVSGTTETADILVYGAQLESSASYKTSYIPTYGTAANRGKDAFSLTDLQGSGILPQLNEGTLFFDLEVSGKRDSAASYRHIRLVDNVDSISNRIRIWEGSAGVISSIRVDFSATNLEHSFSADTPNKVAVSWGAGGTKIFVNGSVTDSTATRLAFASTPKLLTNVLSNYNFSQILLFPTELTQAEVETLTTL